MKAIFFSYPGQAAPVSSALRAVRNQWPRKMRKVQAEEEAKNLCLKRAQPSSVCSGAPWPAAIEQVDTALN